MDYEFWSLMVAFVVAAVFVTGFLTSKKLPLGQRTLRIKQSAALALIPFFLFILVSPPNITSIAAVFKQPSDIQTERATNNSEYDSAQDVRIAALEDEIRDLRSDVYELNVFYKGVCRIFAAFGFVAVVITLKNGQENSSAD